MVVRGQYRWVVVTLIFLITVLNYIDRASISYALPAISREFHLSAGQEGVILGVFGMSYVVGTFAGGILADRVSTRKLLCWGALLWAGSIFLTGFATGFISLAVVRILLGLTEGPNFPAMARAVSIWLPQREHGKALALSLVSIPVALSLGGPLVSHLVTGFGWRIMFFILAGMVVLWLPFWWILYRDNPRQSAHVSVDECRMIQAEGNSENQCCSHGAAFSLKVWKYLLSTPTLLANYWGFFVIGCYVSFFMGWLPAYLVRQYELTLDETGLLAFSAWLVAAVLMLVSGSLSDWILERSGSLRWARTFLMVISQILAAVCMLPLALGLHHLGMVMVLIALAIGFTMSVIPVANAVNIDVAKEQVGTAQGVICMAFALASFSAPVLAGHIVDVTGKFQMAFMMLVLLSVSSVAIVSLFHRPDLHQAGVS